MDKNLQFHIDHQYYVKVNPLPKMVGCFVVFPANKFSRQTETNRTYIINEDQNGIELFSLDYGKDIVSKKIFVDKLAIRLLILEDILLHALARKMSLQLIRLENTTCTSIFTLLNINIEQDELELERELFLRFRALLSGRVHNDLTHVRLIECYSKVLECFENGGL